MSTIATTPWQLSAFADEAGSPIEDQIAALNKADFTRVDLRNVGPTSIVDLPLSEAEAVKARLDDAGISVAMYGSPIGKLDIADEFAKDEERLKHLGKLKPVFGATMVRMFSYYNKDEAPMETWQEISVDRLKRLRDIAADLGLVLYHENERHIFGDLPEQVQVLADELRDGDAFKLIFDFDNYNQSELDVWEVWQQFKNVTDAFHLKDSTSPPNAMHVPIGQGNGQAEKILTDALEMGWTGPVTLEPHLVHSKAVMATGPSGQANQSLAEFTPAEAFELAADTAKSLLAKIDAPWR